MYQIKARSDIPKVGVPLGKGGPWPEADEKFGKLVPVVVKE